jgi:hypothetical protein
MFDDICTCIDMIKKAGLGPVPQPRRVGDPEGRKDQYVVATFYSRHDAGVFAQCWNRWRERSDKWKKVVAVLSDE